MTDIQQRLEENLSQQAFMTSLGARVGTVMDGEVHIELPFSAHLAQRNGGLHAGAAISIAHIASAYAAVTQLGAEKTAVVAEIKINFLRPIMGEHFVAIGRVAHKGKTMSVCTCEVQAFQAGTVRHKVAALVQATLVHVPNHKS